MGTRKNFLVFALFLNLVFFLGVTFFVSRQLSQGVDQTPMTSWLASATLQITSAWSQDQKDMAAQRLTLQALNEMDKKKTFASAQGLTMVFEKKEQAIEEILGRLKTFPFPQELFDKNLLGVHRSKDELVFSSFSKTVPHLVLSKSRPVAPMTQTLKVMGIDLSLVENINGEKLVLFSSLAKKSAQELLAQVDFNGLVAPLDADLSTAMGSSFLITVAQQKHLALMFSLAETTNLQQIAVFTLVLPSYESLSTTEFILYIWAFFCVSLALTLLVYFKTKENK